MTEGEEEGGGIEGFGEACRFVVVTGAIVAIPFFFDFFFDTGAFDEKGSTLLPLASIRFFD